FGTQLAYKNASQTKNIFTMKFALKINSASKEAKHYKYYKCDRCGYISMVKNSYCPICEKDGYKLKLK
ncbi:MAG: hypothetical protein KAT05_07485, partial [Spirochaetes bacterium]|nr:hypothetical protein [Spirochaetota bacterium]